MISMRRGRWRTGRLQDDILDAGIDAVEVEDSAGGSRVAEPVPDILDPVGGRRNGGAVRAGGQVQVAERDQADQGRGQDGLLL
ncbi:hypothetical protein [Streptomyces sp. B21-101]|uniref:hypothetical protein n=1 Tax=Streptomyces sp. B21-101 TaxID=3039415 RepID=UPI002FEEF18F